MVTPRPSSAITCYPGYIERWALKVLAHHLPLVGYFFEPDIRSGNHVSIYLIVGKNQSVRLNISKRDQPTLYRKKYRPYIDSKSSVHSSGHQGIDSQLRGLTVTMEMIRRTIGEKCDITLFVVGFARSRPVRGRRDSSSKS